MPLSVGDFRNLFRTGPDEELSTTALKKTEGYVTLVDDKGEERLKNVGRKWGERTRELVSMVTADADGNRKVKHALIDALTSEGASKTMLNHARRLLGMVNDHGEVDEAGTARPLLRRALRQILSDFDSERAPAQMRGEMARARQELEQDPELQRKGVKSALFSSMLSLSQLRMAQDFMNGGSARVVFQGGRLTTASNIGAFGRMGKASSAKSDSVKSVLTFVQHKIESGLGWRAMARTAQEKDENNRARVMFLAAVFNELRLRGIANADFDNMPAEIKNALHLEDFGSRVVVHDGKLTIYGTQGKPLTARRVIAVAEAINNVFGLIQNEKVASSEEALLGVFTGRIAPSATKSLSHAAAVSCAREALAFARDVADGANSVEQTFRCAGQSVTICANGGELKIRIGGKEASYPGGRTAFIQALEKDVATHVKFYGKQFVLDEMHRLEAKDAVPPQIQGGILRLDVVKQQPALSEWRHRKQGALVSLYQDVLKSVIGEAAYKQLPIGLLPFAALRILANNALEGAYPNAAAVNRLIAEVEGYGDRLQLSSETIIGLAQRLDADKLEDLDSVESKVMIRHEDTTVTRADLERKAEQIHLDASRRTVRNFVARVVMDMHTSSGRASLGQRLLAAAAEDPVTFRQLMDDPDGMLELYDNGAGESKTEADAQAEQKVRAEMKRVLQAIKGSDSWLAICNCVMSSEVRNQVVLPLLATAIAHGVNSPEVEEQKPILGAKVQNWLGKMQATGLLGRPDLPAMLDRMLAAFRDPELKFEALDEPTLKFVEGQSKLDRARTAAEKAVPAPKEMTEAEIDAFMREQELNEEARKVHGFVADLLLEHDTVLVDVQRRSGAGVSLRLLDKVMRNFDGFTLLLQHTDRALESFSFDFGAKPKEGEEGSEGSPAVDKQGTALAESLRRQIGDAIQAMKDKFSISYVYEGEEKTFKLAFLLEHISPENLKAIFTCLHSAARDGVETEEFKAMLKETTAAIANPLVKQMFTGIFGTDEAPKADAITALLKRVDDAGAELNATLNTAVNSSLSSVAEIMQESVMATFGLSPKEVDDILADLRDDDPQGPMVGFDPETEWRKNLSEYTGGSALNPKVGLGKFIVRSLLTYFTRPLPPGQTVDLDKFNMVASLIRYTGRKSTAGELLGALLRGAGPIMQKLLQGIPATGLPSDFAKALAGMKDDLAPIDDHVVEAQLYNMVQESGGKITKIEVVRSLGAASVGQAFQCRMTKADGSVEDVVVKLLRPDVANRAQREKDFFRKVAANVRGMKHTFEGQLATILDELDLTIEAGNVQLGRVYHKNPDARICSVELHPLVRPTTDTMVMKLAPGQTITKYVEWARGRMAEIRAEIQHLVDIPGGGTKQVSSPATYERFVALRRELVEIGQQLSARNNQLCSLTSQWMGEAVFRNGFFHGDLHAGNIMSDGETLTVIDFGNATKLTPVEQASMVKVVCACVGRRIDDFLGGFRDLLSPEGRRSFDALKARMRPMVEAILNKGKSGEAGQRILAVISLLQQNGIEIPSQINKFAQSMMRLCDSVTQTESATLEVISLLQQLASPGIRREGPHYRTADFSTKVNSIRESDFTEEMLMMSIRNLRVKSDNYLRQSLVNAMSLESGAVRMKIDCTTPSFSADGKPVMVDSYGGYFVQEYHNVGHSFDQALPGIVEQLLASGSTIDVVPDAEPVDLGARAQAQLDEYLQQHAKLEAELRGGDHPLITGTGDLREEMFARMSGLRADIVAQKRQLEAAEGEEETTAMQQKINECETWLARLESAGQELNAKALPLVDTLARIFEIQSNQCADELEAGLSSKVPPPSDFGEAFNSCAVANVRSAISKLGLFKGLFIGNAMDRNKTEEDRLYTATSNQIEHYMRDAELSGLDIGTGYSTTMSQLVKNTIVSSALGFTFPAGIDAALEGGAWMDEDGGDGPREQVFEMLAHNLSNFRDRLVKDLGFTEQQIRLGSGKDGYPKQSAGEPYEVALRRYRITGMLLYALSASGGVKPGLLISLQTATKEDYDRIVGEMRSWAEAHPDLCDEGTLQLMVDMLSLASYGPAVEDDSVFCPDLFMNSDNVTIVLGDSWRAGDEQNDIRAKNDLRRRKTSFEEAVQTGREELEQRIQANTHGVIRADDPVWGRVLTPREKFIRADRDRTLRLESRLEDKDAAAKFEQIRADYDQALKDAATLSADGVLVRLRATPGLFVDGRLDPMRIHQQEGRATVTDQMINGFMKEAEKAGMPVTLQDRSCYRALLSLFPAGALHMLEPGSRKLDVIDRNRSSKEEDIRESNAALIVGEVKRVLGELGGVIVPRQLPRPVAAKKEAQPVDGTAEFELARMKHSDPLTFTSLEMQRVFNAFTAKLPEDDPDLRSLRDEATAPADRAAAFRRLKVRLREQLLSVEVPQGGGVLSAVHRVIEDEWRRDPTLLLDPNDPQSHPAPEQIPEAARTAWKRLLNAVGIDPALHVLADKVVESLSEEMRLMLYNGGGDRTAVLQEVRGIILELDMVETLEHEQGAAALKPELFAQGDEEKIELIDGTLFSEPQRASLGEYGFDLMDNSGSGNNCFFYSALRQLELPVTAKNAMKLREELSKLGPLLVHDGKEEVPTSNGYVNVTELRGQIAARRRSGDGFLGQNQVDLASGALLAQYAKRPVKIMVFGYGRQEDGTRGTFQQVTGMMSFDRDLESGLPLQGKPIELAYYSMGMGGHYSALERLGHA